MAKYVLERNLALLLNMQKSYNFSRAIPRLPTRLLSCRAHIRRDSCGMMGVAARSTLSQREVMSKNRGIRRTRRKAKEYPKLCYLLHDSLLFKGNLSSVKL